MPVQSFGRLKAGFINVAEEFLCHSFAVFPLRELPLLLLKRRVSYILSMLPIFSPVSPLNR